MYLDNLTDKESRIIRAKFDDFYFEDIDFENQSATTVGSSNKKYKTSLNYCSCQDFQKRKKPCKHIYRLTYKLGKFDLYENIEQEQIADKINQIKDLITAEKLKDIYYRKRDYGDRYYLSKDYQTDFLENIGIIKLYDIPVYEIVENLYKAQELKDILKEKYSIKGLKKKDLIELYSNDETLVKSLPINEKYKVDILIDEINKNFLIDCINYRIYNQLQYKDEIMRHENDFYEQDFYANNKTNNLCKIEVDLTETSNKCVANFENKLVQQKIIKNMKLFFLILFWPIGLCVLFKKYWHKISIKSLLFLNLLNFIFFVSMAVLSNSKDDTFATFGCLSMLAIPVLLILLVVKFISQKQRGKHDTK